MSSIKIRLAAILAVAIMFFVVGMGLIIISLVSGLSEDNAPPPTSVQQGEPNPNMDRIHEIRGNHIRASEPRIENIALIGGITLIAISGGVSITVAIKYVDYHNINETKERRIRLHHEEEDPKNRSRINHSNFDD
jgi:flagellar basal body-associated protein FliL